MDALITSFHSKLGKAHAAAKNFMNTHNLIQYKIQIGSVYHPDLPSLYKKLDCYYGEEQKLLAVMETDICAMNDLSNEAITEQQQTSRSVCDADYKEALKRHQTHEDMKKSINSIHV